MITVKPDDTLLNAHAKMSLYEISQLPVVQDGRVVGIIDEWDILTATESGNEQTLKDEVRLYMSTNVATVSIEDELSRVIALLKEGLLVIVIKDGQFFGVITKTDYIHYLRRKLS
ncbi:inosine 5'-monophosphate dehydrogenase [compost metagenome]